LDLRQEVVRRFNVTVHESTIGKWLRQLGLTRLQPRPYHPKKDAAAQETFKKTHRPGPPGAPRIDCPLDDRDLVVKSLPNVTSFSRSRMSDHPIVSLPTLAD
ncbi:MAG: winged helix-turn-helix domain-containing protein, partial [Alphaproteobacteria bacterium]|nr:winged helix-turn-helix domain-containing protein [Alphaproteobacteria bacterium]